MFKYFTSALLLLLSFCAMAQPAANKDTIATPGIRIGIEAGRAAWGFVNPQVQQYEISADYGWGRRYHLVTEIGRAAVNPVTPESYNYTASGFYQRLGVDYNFLKGDDMVFGGIRYAYSRYTDQFTNIVVDHPYFRNQTLDYPTPPSRNITAHWAELTGGVRARLVGQLYIGFIIRYKIPIRLNADNQENLPPYYTPGYGRAMRSGVPGFNYYISYRIPFRR
jgi:hypothetical protein